MKRLLLVEGNPERSRSIRELMGNGDVEATPVETGSAALSRLGEGAFDCVVLDLGLPDVPGLAVVERLRDIATAPPVIVIRAAIRPLTKRAASPGWPRRSS